MSSLFASILQVVPLQQLRWAHQTRARLDLCMCTCADVRAWNCCAYDFQFDLVSSFDKGYVLAFVSFGFSKKVMGRVFSPCDWLIDLPAQEPFRRPQRRTWPRQKDRRWLRTGQTSRDAQKKATGEERPLKLVLTLAFYPSADSPTETLWRLFGPLGGEGH